MNATIERIRLYAKQLKLPTVAHPEQLLREALANQWSYEEFLVQLLHTEAEQRKEEPTATAAKSSQIPFVANTGYLGFRQSGPR
jgi:DNA replication protein DnaC